MFRDPEYSFCQSVLYFGFQGTPVTVRMFTPVRKYVFPLPNFTLLARSDQHYVEISCAEFHPHRTINVESMRRASLTSVSQV
jgi:hypothetical protein